MKKILMSLLTVALVSSIAIGATQAYFSDTEIISGNTFASGSVTIGETRGLPFSFTNLIPTIEQSKNADVQYVGTTPADIYVGIAHQSGFAFFDPTGPTSYIQVAIKDRQTGDLIRSWTDAEHYFANWTKIATNVSPNQWKYYEILVRLKSNAGNELQNKTNHSKLVIRAVQAGVGVQETKLPWEFGN
jgi:predicted ribosomally synthesized peptide with SipW-like signal peptide